MQKKLSMHEPKKILFTTVIMLQGLLSIIFIVRFEKKDHQLRHDKLYAKMINFAKNNREMYGNNTFRYQIFYLVIIICFSTKSHPIYADNIFFVETQSHLWNLNIYNIHLWLAAKNCIWVVFLYRQSYSMCIGWLSFFFSNILQNRNRLIRWWPPEIRFQTRRCEPGENKSAKQFKNTKIQEKKSLEANYFHEYIFLLVSNYVKSI